MATKITVEKQTNNTSDTDADPGAPSEPHAEPQEPTKKKRGRPAKPKEATGYVMSEKQRLAALHNLKAAPNGHLRIKDLQQKVNELADKLEQSQIDAEKHKNEAERQKQKKKARKEEVQSLQQLLLKESGKKPPKKEEKAEETIRENPVPAEPAPPDPRKDPRVRKMMSQGADYKTALLLLGLQ